jgi:hypothetical protein
MKRLSAALVATALLTLAGCGSRTVNNSAALDNTSDYFNVTSDDLTANDLGSNVSGNGSSSGNASSSANSSTSNASGNSQ